MVIIEREVISLETKTCNTCDVELPLTSEYFYRKRDTKDGYRGYCKECSKLKLNGYYSENKAKMREQENKRRRGRPSILTDEQKEKNRLRSREFYKENVDEIRVKRKGHRRKLSEKQKQEQAIRMEQYYKLNKEKILRSIESYRNSERGKEVQRMHWQKRRNRKRGVPTSFTLDEWEKCKEYFLNRCCYCDLLTNDLHQDHFIPLSKGGEYTKQNIVPSCESCNKKKHATSFYEWYPRYEFYDEERQNKILKYLGYEDKYQQLSIL